MYQVFWKQTSKIRHEVIGPFRLFKFHCLTTHLDFFSSTAGFIWEPIETSFQYPEWMTCLFTFWRGNVYFSQCKLGILPRTSTQQESKRRNFCYSCEHILLSNLFFAFLNDLATFNRNMDIVLNTNRCLELLAFLDNFIIFPKNLESHVKNIDDVFQMQRQAKISLEL